MIDVGVLALPVVVVAIVGLLTAVGCEGRNRRYELSMVFHYDPDLMVDGEQIVVGRVSFMMDAGQGYRDEFRIAADGTVTWLRDGSFRMDGFYGYADPAHGDFRCTVGYPETQLGIRCEAYRNPNDAAPAFPSDSTAIEAVLGTDLAFRFRLVQVNGRWVVAPE